MKRGLQPVAGEAQPVSCRAERNSWLRNGSPFASRFHSEAGTRARVSMTSMELIVRTCPRPRLRFGARRRPDDILAISSMKIAIAQLNATVGDLAGNTDRIADFAERARNAGADLVVTPELALCGYPPEDLLLREDFLEACERALLDLAARAKGITLVVGHPRASEGKRYNSTSII